MSLNITKISLEQTCLNGSSITRIPPLNTIVPTTQIAQVRDILNQSDVLLSGYYRNNFTILGKKMYAYARLAEFLQKIRIRTGHYCVNDSTGIAGQAVELFVALQTQLVPWFNTHNGTHLSPPFSVLDAWGDATLKNSSKGIVVCGGDQQFSYLLALVWNIRHVHHCDLPIEIFYIGTDDLSLGHRMMLESMAPNIRTRDVFDSVSLEFAHLRGWDIKPFAIMYSNFSQVMLVDCDVGLLQSPMEFFEHPTYVETGSLFFHDRTWPGEGYDSMYLVRQLVSGRNVSNTTKLLRSYVKGISEHEMESGVVMVDKTRGFLGILGAMKLHDLVEKEVLSTKTHGDKESYWIAYEMMGLSFGFSNYYPGSIGNVSIRMNSTCGRMLHFDANGQPMWWNGGYKNAEKHSVMYNKLDYIEMMWYDDGGKLYEPFQNLSRWSCEFPNWNYCSSKSFRGPRRLSIEHQHIAKASIKTFAILAAA